MSLKELDMQTAHITPSSVIHGNKYTFHVLTLNKLLNV